MQTGTKIDRGWRERGQECRLTRRMDKLNGPVISGRVLGDNPGCLGNGYGRLQQEQRQSRAPIHTCDLATWRARRAANGVCHSLRTVRCAHAHAWIDGRDAEALGFTTR